MKILVVIAGGLGDCIFYSYIFSAIKRKYPQSHLTCVVWSHGYPHPYKNNPFIDHIVEVTDHRALNRNEALKQAVTGQHFEVVYAINHLRELYYFLDTCTFDKFFAHYSYDEAYRKAVPDKLLKILDSLKELGIEYPFFDLPQFSKRFEFYYSDEDLEKAKNIMNSLNPHNKTVVIQLFSDDVERTVPMATQLKLIERLVRNHFNVVAVGRVDLLPNALGKYTGLMSLMEHMPLGAQVIIDRDDRETLGLYGLVPLINEADYFITPLTSTIAVADLTMTPTISVIGYRPSIQDLIVQYCHYAPNIAILLDDLSQLDFTKVNQCMQHFRSFSKWTQRYPSTLAGTPETRMIMDYRAKHKQKTNPRPGEDEY